MLLLLLLFSFLGIFVVVVVVVVFCFCFLGERGRAAADSQGKDFIYSFIRHLDFFS